MNKVERLAYLVRCANACTDLIRDAAQTRFQTREQLERVLRWQRVRRRLLWEMESLRHSLPYATQLVLEPTDTAAGMAMHWKLTQAEAFANDGKDGSLMGEVGDVSTPRGEVL